MTLSNYMNRKELVGFLILAAVIFLVLPMALDTFRLNLFGKYLTYAFVAIGLALCWGAGGILSLGQGIFFGLGGYCMAMFLKLEASTPRPRRSSRRPAFRTSWTGTRSPNCPSGGSRSTS